MVDIRHVRPQDWELLKSIRLQALADSPEAFCVTYEEAASYGDDVWIERSSATPSEGASASIVAMDGALIVGLAVGVLCDDRSLDVVSVFVDPEHRGDGTAQKLMDVIEAWGIDRGAERSILDVEAGNDRAGTFYAKLGYTPTGKRETYPGRVWLHRVELAKSLSS